MKKNKSNLYQNLITLLISGVLFMSINALAAARSEIETAANLVGANAVTELSFQKGGTRLQSNARDELNRFVVEARKKGEIKKVQVLAWSDQEYPPEGVSQAKSQLALADKRAENIESFIKSKFDIDDVTKMNMGVRPNVMQNAVQTTTAQTKNMMEQSGAAPTHEQQIGIFGANGKASRAVVLIFYK